jgi:hypothetical protein
MEFWRKCYSTLIKLLSALILIFSLSACGEKAVSQMTPFKVKDSGGVSGQISEIAPPKIIQQLGDRLENYQPLVSILQPTPNQILQDDTVTVRLQVKDLPIYKDPQFGLGPHLNVILDKQHYTTIYDLNQSLVFSKLAPGTHTLRVFAQRPWNESFKNDGAYAQTTFHVLTPSDDNNPEAQKPLLTLSSPQGSYGAEPILLDFYLVNAPLHLLATEDFDDGIGDWRIRCTVNGESFVFDKWQAIYLKGFKPGKNWVKLEFLDGQGNIVKNVFNNIVTLVDYNPQAKDTLSQIVRGEISFEKVRSIVDPSYITKISQPQVIQEKLPSSKSVDIEKSKIEKNQSLTIENPIKKEVVKSSSEASTVDINKNQSLTIENPIKKEVVKPSSEASTVDINKNQSLTIENPIKQEVVTPSSETSTKTDKKIDSDVKYQGELKFDKEVVIPQIDKMIPPQAEESNSQQKEDKKLEEKKLEVVKSQGLENSTPQSKGEIQQSETLKSETSKSETLKSITNKFGDFFKRLPLPNLPGITATPEIVSNHDKNLSQNFGSESRLTSYTFTQKNLEE